MKNTFSSNNSRPPKFATLASAGLFALGVTLALWMTSPPVTQAAQPTATPITSPTPTPGPGDQKCPVCHTAPPNPHTIYIDCNALQAHLRNHPEDSQGPCPPTPTPTPKPTP